MTHPPTTNNMPQLPIIDQQMLDANAQDDHKPALAFRLTSIAKNGQRMAISKDVHNFAAQVLVVLP